MRCLVEGEGFSEGVIVGLLEKVNVAIEEGEQLEEEDGVGREVDAHERHEGNHLVDIDESPKSFHARLA